MSLFSVQARKHTVYYDHLMSTPTSRTKEVRKVSDPPSSEDRRSGDKSRNLNKTYVISAVARTSTATRTRLTLQRRSRRRTGETLDGTQTSIITPAPEKRLTMQRRTKTPTGDRTTPRVSVQNSTNSKVLSESNGRFPSVYRSTSLRDTQARDAPSSSSLTCAGRPADHVFKTPTKQTQFGRIAAKRDVFEKLTARETPRLVVAKGLERSKSRVQQMLDSRPVPAPRGVKTPGPRTNAAPQVRTSTVLKVTRTPSTCQKPEESQSRTPSICQKPEESQSRTPSICQKPEESQSRTSEGVKTQHSLKMENSAVTVAVRLRPFNGRETAEEAVQVIFMNGQETVVQNPVSKQSYSFTYDFSFCSVDKTEAAFASQKTVYDTLARPLLLRAFEGFNTCLFAYGQTGSGKSYTMMGFGEEAGVIPRFCQELFSKLATMVTEEVKCHVEMSYFEVYNEKIHDLLVTRDEPNQRRMPLRVREHPVHGPYVAELSANVVGSYNDVKGWLELGNKQRATAATGMNDKSSRSHSVFTLVMTQTKTEYVEGEEHDHSITSRINLVDLAGSERCNSAQTSGDRLREGASINKSLLTLGKVISALSEQALSRKKVFTPYRESVLTWLLKESLGGNSKTTMIATLSPAGSNMEESLSTLRYAQQARTIINVAKVNEDTSAKLIRELKAEVEKLRAAQMSAQGIEPERVRLFQQEVAALKNRLCQQEREMLEANRAWREKLEQAEIRKREETKELQKAGVTFKVDNRLPNLVNLNEDPQLSEMLLYMIKEGRTTVGKLKSESSHDIQLNGALIADQHCTITNMDGTVSIIPKDNAKTFVNGNLITDTTVLHHGDRVILGGDHYFRFNHPAQVESGKRVSCWTGSGDGQKKDFEFAKNELLSAQRAQLEAEIEEAQVKAKEEMMQGIQMAKEVAQKELSEQKALYEERIQTLESELNQENESKRLQELQQQRVASQMEQLKMAKLELQQEVDSHKKRLRLHMEAQAMEDRRVCQARIVDALEAEKRKISKELEDIQKKRAMREVNAPRNAGSQWDSMKLSLMIEEANKISTNLNKKTVFSRHEGSNDDKPESGDALQVRVQNTKLGISTFWSLDRFQNNMAAMRELEQGDSTSKDDAVFYDPADEWEQDISSSSASTSSLSRRRSRSLLKSRRISGRLYEIRVHPIQSLNRDATQTCGLMGVNKPPSTHSSTSDSATPGICKDLVGQSLARLRSSRGPEESLADRLASDMYLVYDAIQTISSDYDRLDDDSQENVFGCNVQTQALLIKASAAVEGGVFVLLLWFSSVRPSSGVFYTLAEELKSQVKKMGGFLQMLIQGCESEITSMVTEARRKSGQCVDALMLALGHLASVTGTPLNAAEPGAAGKPSVVASLQKGVNKGVRSLLENNLQLTREMLREAQLAFPRNLILKSLKSKTLDLARALQNFMHQMLTKEREKASEEAEEGEDQSPSTLQTLKTYANKLFELKKSVLQLNTCLSSALRGKDGEANSSRELITASAKAVDELISARDGDETISSHHSSDQMVMGSREELHDALRSLLSAWDDPEETGSVDLEESSSLKDSSDGVRSRAGLKTMTKQHSHGVLSKGSPHWV